jgi:A/G-specific adenine glycosylase
MKPGPRKTASRASPRRARSGASGTASPRAAQHTPSDSQAARIDPAIVAPLLAWFDRSARDLPWRVGDPITGVRDPYRVLVSEVMLQQTQVARVIEKFAAFLTRFPTVRALAAAPEDDVLAAWTGLGYYRRARLLHACAKRIVERHAGQIPAEIAALRELPGIGAYTAGAIASLAFAKPEPLVDTNVSRVLLRIAGKQLAVSDKAASAWAWEQARDLVHVAAEARGTPLLRARNRPGAWNEALMELGATVCTLPTPRCVLCPVQPHCRAFATGKADAIPLPSRKAARSAITHHCLLIRDRQGRVLVEQRPATATGGGLWAGLWQLPTVESVPLGEDKADSMPPATIARQLGLKLPQKPRWRAHEPFLFKTTHRDVRFFVVELLTPAPATIATTPQRRWCDETMFRELGWSSPMKRLVAAVITTPAASPAPPARSATRS